MLVGGLVTQISEETHLPPKPMIEIDAKPICDTSKSTRTIASTISSSAAAKRAIWSRDTSPTISRTCRMSP